MRENESRRVWKALIATSAVVWALSIALAYGTGGMDPDSAPGLSMEGVVVGGILAAVIHLALLLSLPAERSGWVIRLAAAVIVLPYLLVSGSATAGILWVMLNQASWVPELALALSLFALHCAQLWRLAGLPIPRLQPLASFNQLNPAPGPGPAPERIAGR